MAGIIPVICAFDPMSRIMSKIDWFKKNPR